MNHIWSTVYIYPDFASELGIFLEGDLQLIYPTKMTGIHWGFTVYICRNFSQLSSIAERFEVYFQ